MSKHTSQIVREGVVVAHALSHISIAFPTDGAVFGEFGRHDGAVGDGAFATRGGYESEVVELPFDATAGHDVILPGTRVMMTIDLVTP